MQFVHRLGGYLLFVLTLWHMLAAIKRGAAAPIAAAHSAVCDGYGSGADRDFGDCHPGAFGWALAHQGWAVVVLGFAIAHWARLLRALSA